MPYVQPTFNLRCRIYSHSAFPTPRVSDVPCNLAWGKRVAVPSTGGTTIVGVPLMTMTLLVPADTDIRGPYQFPGSDLVEVPQGSGRLYEVAFADFIGMGFANQHKGAVLVQNNPFLSPDTP